ncbi:hypothetical protein [[Eubacterium] cellulosolvens]
MINSKRIALITIFAALTAILDSIPGIPQFVSGVWYGWVFLIEPIIGFVLGPLNGFLSVLIGVLIGHYIYFRGPYEFIFTLGAPIGAMISGMLYRGNKKFPFLFFSFLLFVYFLVPISFDLPLWGIWDVLLAFGLFLTIMLMKIKRIRPVFSAFIGLESDVLFRIFILVPLQTYKIFYGFNLEAMKLIWKGGAFITPIQVGLSLFFTILAFPLLKKATRRFSSQL